MGLIDRWVRRPQTVWARKALFQIHLWTGIGAGLYVFVLSVSGSAVVFRAEISRALTPTTYVPVKPPALSTAALGARAEQTFPKWKVTQVWPQKRPNVAVEIWMTRGRFQRQELFDPYTGESVGEAVPRESPTVRWLVALHDDLLGGQTGRAVNGAGAVVLVVLCITGAVIWWPGVAAWRRSLMLHRNVGWKRVTWDLHGALGFWMWLFVLMWGVSGVYFAFPGPFNATVDRLEPIETATEPRIGDNVLVWLARLHFGRFAGPGTKAAWVVLGLAPAVLVVTGGLMWWNRVLSKRRLFTGPEPAEAQAALEAFGTGPGHV